MKTRSSTRLFRCAPPPPYLLAACALITGALATPSHLHAQSWKTLTATRQVTNEDHLRVEVRYGAGVLTVRRADEGTLYSALFHFDEELATHRTKYTDGRLEVGLNAGESRSFNFGDRASDASLELELAPGLPMDLEMDFGAGRAEVDLSGLAVQRLEVNTGASESVLRVGQVNPVQMRSGEINAGAADLRVDGVGNLNADMLTVTSGLASVVLQLDGEWPRDGRLGVEMGLGALELRIPRSLGVRLRLPGSVLASIDTEGLQKRGKVYESANWKSAEHKVEIEIAAVLGSVDIEWIP